MLSYNFNFSSNIIRGDRWKWRRVSYNSSLIYVFSNEDDFLYGVLFFVLILHFYILIFSLFMCSVFFYKMLHYFELAWTQQSRLSGQGVYQNLFTLAYSSSLQLWYMLYIFSELGKTFPNQSFICHLNIYKEHELMYLT